MKLAKLAESNRAKRISQALIKKGRHIGLFLYLVGIVLHCLFPAEGFHRKKFFDENALLTGLSRREFKDAALISDLQNKYREYYKSPAHLHKWIYSTFNDYGLEAYTHTYSLSHTVQPQYHQNKTSGSNIYGILRAGRTPSVEAIVLAAPDVLDFGEESAGVSVILALAKYFSRQNYWAKDIIFLISNGGILGIQSWINSYTGTQSSVINSSPITGRSGSLQAVVNIEIGRGNIHHINVIPEGVNSILPNLDLVFVASTLCETEHIPITYHMDWSNPKFFGIQSSSYYMSVGTSVAVLFHHATGLPNANHAPFLSHRIDSVTLQGIHGTSDSNVQQLENLSRALEGIFRSINNLLERLHHSEFFYINMSSNTFISIGQYSSFFGLLLSPLLIECLRQWLLFRSGDKEVGQSSYATMGIPPQISVSFSPLFMIIMSSLVGGCGLYFCPSLMHYFSVTSSYWILCGCQLFIWIVSVVVSLWQRPIMTVQTYHLTSAIICLLVTVVLYSLALMHFALSLFLTITLILPLSLSTSNSLCSSLVLVVFSPPLLVLYYVMFYLLMLTEVDPNTSSIKISLQFLLSGVEKSYFFYHLSSAWLYPMVCLMLCPVWFLCWSLGIAKVNLSEHAHLKTQ